MVDTKSTVEEVSQAGDEDTALSSPACVQIWPELPEPALRAVVQGPGVRESAGWHYWQTQSVFSLSL